MIFQHHAYLLIGGENSVDAVLARLKPFLGNLTPTVWQNDMWKIEDSRQVKEWQVLTPVAGLEKVGVIICHSMTEAAGQALLKVLEEPARGVCFFLAVPHLGAIIETLRSRFIVLDSAVPILPPAGWAEKFLANSPVERLKQLEQLVAPNQLVIELEKILALRRPQLKPAVFSQAGERVRLAARRLNRARVPTKLVLETLALTLPPVML